LIPDLTSSEQFFYAAILYLIGVAGSAVVAILFWKANKRFNEIVKKLEELTRE